MARVGALIPDLLFGSKVQAALEQAGHEVDLLSSESDAWEQSSGIDVLVVDLTTDALDGVGIVDSLKFDIVGEWSVDMNQLVKAFQVQIRGREFAFEMQGFFFQMAEIDSYGHNTIQEARFTTCGLRARVLTAPSFVRRAVTTCEGTNALTSPPNRAISFTIRELRNV